MHVICYFKNCKAVPIACATSPGGHSECGYTNTTYYCDALMPSTLVGLREWARI